MVASPPLQFGFDAGGTVSLQVALFDANGTDMRKHPGWSPPAQGVYLLSCEVRSPSHRLGRGGQRRLLLPAPPSWWLAPPRRCVSVLPTRVPERL